MHSKSGVKLREIFDNNRHRDSAIRGFIFAKAKEKNVVRGILQMCL